MPIGKKENTHTHTHTNWHGSKRKREMFRDTETDIYESDISNSSENMLKSNSLSQSKKLSRIKSWLSGLFF